MRDIIYRSSDDEQLELLELAKKQPDTYCYMQAPLIFFHFAIQDLQRSVTMSQKELDTVFCDYFRTRHRSRVWLCKDDVIYPPDWPADEHTKPAILVGETDTEMTFRVEEDQFSLPTIGFKPFGYVVPFLGCLFSFLRTKCPHLNNYTIEHEKKYCFAIRDQHVVLGKYDGDQISTYDFEQERFVGLTQPDRFEIIDLGLHSTERG